MKILHIITSLQTGGAEHLVVDLLPEFCKLGNEVDLLVFDGTRTPFMEELEKKGIRIYNLGVGQNVYHPLHILKLRRFLKGYDIIHTHNTACQMFVAIAKAITLSKCKLVTTEHNTYNRRRSMLWIKPFDLWMYKQYAAIISISEIATKLLIEYIGSNNEVITIPNGVNVDKFHTAQPNNEARKEGDVIVSMVAGFRVQKDQDTLIRSLIYLPANYKVWLLGDGIRRGEIEALVKELLLTDRVKLFGVRSDIPEILQASDIVVLSSRYEGLSLSSIEGMSVDKPFIASDVKGLHEITEGAGILFPYQDDKKLAEEILKLMNDNVYYRQVAAACYERAQQFSISSTVKGYIDVYNKVFL